MGCASSKEDWPSIVVQESHQHTAQPPRKARRALNPFSKPAVPQIIIWRTPDPRTRITPTMTAYDVRIFGADDEKHPAPKKVHFASRHTTMTFGTITSTLEIPAVKYGDVSNIALSNADSPHRLAAVAKQAAVVYADKPFSERADSVAHVEAPRPVTLRDTVLVASTP